MVKLSKRDNLHKLHNLSLLVELVQMLKLAYIVQWDKMHNYALCLLEEFKLD